MNLKKRIAALALTSAMAVGTMTPVLAETAAKDDLASQMAGNISRAITENLGEELKVYSNIDTVKWTQAQPSRFDLRDRGIVPSIRSQGALGTCWSFASIGATEISVLNSLGKTAEEFAEEYGTEMDLSEKHLAWFSTVPLPEAEDEDQAGEGRYMLDPDGPVTDHYWTGGFMGYASGLFASGMGPIPEFMAPYANSEGTDSMAGDWSLEESMRFMSAYELKDSSILPSPAGRDAEGKYVYNPIATSMIKSELLNGRAVSIIYCADQAVDPEYRLKASVDHYAAMGYDPYLLDILLRGNLNLPLPEDELTPEVALEVYRLSIALTMGVPMEEITDEIVAEVRAANDAEYAATMAEAAAMADDEAAQEEMLAQMQAEADAKIAYVAEKFGVDPELLAEVVSSSNGDEQQYFVNWETYAQYISDQNMPGNHAVTIVGYDDDYAISNFREDNAPPAPGAWIVRNSWGSDYGIDGYLNIQYRYAPVESFLNRLL